jgi:predicted dehydrogenase
MAEKRTGPVGVGIIGAGVISGTYLDNLKSFPDVEVLAVADILTDKAKAKAEEKGIAAAGDNSVVLDHPDVELVINLTTPDAHAEVALSAITAGKHVWNEKPLALDRPSGQALLKAAEEKGLRVGCAPDTFLGAGLQATFKALQEGAIGEPLSGLILFQSPGPESWHPNPAFLFQEGAGPLFDIGPYYLTASVQSFGPASSVAAIGSKAKAKRVIGSGPLAGQEFDVTVPSQTAGLVRFEGGQSLTAIFSFDSPQPRTLLEITGTEATLLVPDPNTFHGDIKIRKPGSDDWETIGTTTEKSSRGTGALDLARAIREDRPHRAQGALAYHILDIMVSLAESGEQGEFVKVESTVERAALLPEDWDPLAKTV